jgi:uncharacterized protein with PIN domain
LRIVGYEWINDPLLKRRSNLKILCIQTRRMLWLKKERQHAKQLVNLPSLLLEKQNLAEQLADLKELQLVSSIVPS